MKNWLLTILILATPQITWADDDIDQDEARALRLEGKILPLSEVLKTAKKAGLVDILELELEKEKGQWVYEIEAITETNRVTEITIDARNGSILHQESDKHRHGEHD